MSEQMNNLLRRFGVTTEEALLEAIAQDDAENTDLSIEDARLIAPVVLDRMLEAEYQRIEGGAYEMSDVMNDETEDTYRIVRFRRDGEPEIVSEGVSLEYAQEHCNDPKTRGVDWFDGYEKEDE